MATTLKEKRDYLRTAAGFTAVALVAAGLIWLGNRNDAITEAERLKSGILTAHQVKTAFEGVGGRIVARPREESDRVAKGDLLMALDPTDVEIAIREAEAQIRSYDAQIAELEGTIELMLRTADTTELETWRRIEEAEAARRTTAADWENARLVFERAKRLRPSGASRKRTTMRPRAPMTRNARRSLGRNARCGRSPSERTRRLSRNSERPEAPKACGFRPLKTPASTRRIFATRCRTSVPCAKRLS